MRELAKELQEQDIIPDNCACGFRVFNKLENIQIPEAEIEKFLEIPTLLSSQFGKCRKNSGLSFFIFQNFSTHKNFF